MSTQTRALLDTAIRAHIAAEAAEQGSTDDFVTHWAVVAGILPTDDGEVHWTEAPDGQASYITTGLLYTAIHATHGDDE